MTAVVKDDESSQTCQGVLVVDKPRLLKEFYN